MIKLKIIYILFVLFSCQSDIHDFSVDDYKNSSNISYSVNFSDDIFLHPSSISKVESPDSISFFIKSYRIFFQPIDNNIIELDSVNISFRIVLPKTLLESQKVTVDDAKKVVHMSILKAHSKVGEDIVEGINKKNAIDKFLSEIRKFFGLNDIVVDTNISKDIFNSCIDANYMDYYDLAKLDVQPK